MHWIAKSKIKGEQWITASIETDEANQVTDSVLYSASVTDTFAMINEIWQFWSKLDVVNWEMPTEALLLSSQVSGNIQGLIEFYCVTLDAKLRAVGFYDTEGQFDISSQLCITLNNLQDVLTNLTDHEQMFAGLTDEILAANELKEETIWPEPGVEILFSKAWDRIRRDLVADFRRILSSTKTELLRRIANLAVLITNNCSGEIKGYLARALDPFNDKDRAMQPEDIEAACDPLLDYLDQNLSTVSEFTYEAVSEDITNLLWQETMLNIKGIYLPDDDTRLIHTGTQNLVMMLIVKPIYDFFHQEGDGLSAEVLNIPAYKAVNDLVQLTGSDTGFLISAYYRRLAVQQPDGPTELGTLKVATTVSTTKNHKFTLTIEVLTGSGLIGMDRKGSSSDPYVIVQIWPEAASNGSGQVIRTKCIKRTLNPAWNETFDFIIDKDINNVSLGLTIWDYESMSKPDPMGEVAIILDYMPRGERVEKDYPVTASCPVPDTADPSGEDTAPKSQGHEAMDNVINHYRKARLVECGEGANEVRQLVKAIEPASRAKPRFEIDWDSLLIGTAIDTRGIFKLLELRGDHVKEAKEWFHRQ